MSDAQKLIDIKKEVLACAASVLRAAQAAWAAAEKELKAAAQAALDEEEDEDVELTVCDDYCSEAEKAAE